MKERIQFYSLSHVLVSFCLFILTGRLCTFLLDTFSAFDSTAAELTAFIISAAIAIISFCFFDKLIPYPAEAHSERPVMDGRFRKRPFPLKRYVLETVPHTILTTALLIAAMYLVTVTFNLTGSMIGEEEPLESFLPILSMMIFHPLAEEYIFRGLYYEKLRTLSPIFACLMQAVMFAISHNGVGGMMYALIAGILLGTAAERSNGIAVPAAAHIAINLRTFLYTGVLPQNLRLPIDMAIIAAGVLSFGALELVRIFLPGYQKTAKNEEPREEAQFDD